MPKAVIRFLSSVKLAIVLIILLVVASIVGTLIPQGRDMAEYAARYGRVGAPLVKLQLTNVFRSVWFLAVLGLFGLNIAACTLTRLGAKVRRVRQARRPLIERDSKAWAAGAGAIRDEVRWKGRKEKGKGLALGKEKGRQGAEGAEGPEGAGLERGLVGQTGGWTGLEGFEGAVRAAEEALRASRYKVGVRTARENGEKDGGTDGERRTILFGRKRMDGIFGSDIVHLGLLVIIAGGIVTAVGGFRTDLVLDEGRIVEVPNAAARAGAIARAREAKEGVTEGAEGAEGGVKREKRAKAGFSVRLDRFETETYADGSVKDWKSTLTVIENGRETRTQVVEVNHPLVYRGFSLYQSAYGYDWDAATLALWIGKSGERAGENAAMKGVAAGAESTERTGDAVVAGDARVTGVTGVAEGSGVAAGASIGAGAEKDARKTGVGAEGENEAAGAGKSAARIGSSAAAGKMAQAGIDTGAEVGTGSRAEAGTGEDARKTGVGTEGENDDKSKMDAVGRMLKISVGAKVALGDAEGTEIFVRRFLPDFVISENGVPDTRSDQPNNPAAFVEARQGGNKVFGRWVFAAFPEFGQSHGSSGMGGMGGTSGERGASGDRGGKGAAPELRIELRDFYMPQYSVIQAARDPGVPFIWLGCLLVMAGLVLAFYRPTWEIRMVVEESADGKIMVRAGGTAAKSRERFAADFARIMSKIGSRSTIPRFP